MHNRNLRFKILNSDQILEINSSAIRKLLYYRQQGDKPEVGGLLFASITYEKVSIKFASDPDKLDYSHRFLFIPNREKQRELIHDYFARGFHFVGEWHTHPEPHPSPSMMDINSMRASFTESRHELHYFVMIIVGNSKHVPLWVSIHNANDYRQLVQE